MDVLYIWHGFSHAIRKHKKMKNKTILAFLSAGMIFFLAACGTSSKMKNSHNSQNALDWSGVYQGVLPCADCEGIQTTLLLKENNHYKLGIEYLGAKEEYTSEDSGKFSWNDAGQVITLDNGDQYFVGENRLLRLDQEGKKVTGKLADRYVLSKENGKLTETYWKLISLNGKKVTVDSTFNREPYLMLKEKDHKVSGNAGCNQIMGSYQLTSGQEIKFSQMASTLMACPNLEGERAYLKVLEKVDHYAVDGEELILSEGKTPLARFKAVYFH